MKYFTILLALLISAFPLVAEEIYITVKMADFDRTYEGFSFTEGDFIMLEGSFPMAIDFIFDMPSGLGMNNSELTDQFPGKAGILDLGQISLDIETEIPVEGFTFFIDPDNLIPGHTYLIKTADEEHYGKIQILQFDKENEILEFAWVYLSE